MPARKGLRVVSEDQQTIDDRDNIGMVAPTQQIDGHAGESGNNVPGEKRHGSGCKRVIERFALSVHVLDDAVMEMVQQIAITPTAAR